MPPPVVKSVRDLIFWQYAKIIAESAGFGKKNYGFVMKKFRQLKEGEIFWNEIREYVKEREKKDECIFCGAKTNLTIDICCLVVLMDPKMRRTLSGCVKNATHLKVLKDFMNFGRLRRDWKELNMKCQELLKANTLNWFMKF